MSKMGIVAGVAILAFLLMVGAHFNHGFSADWVIPFLVLGGLFVFAVIEKAEMDAKEKRKGPRP